ncbi:MAG: hypothetical protein HYZ16_10455 [Bacteroidetes bacterium]|nr:hypothetical protein [Bacteroidota bacterium]
MSMLSLRVEAQQVSYFIESDTTFYPIGTAIVLKQTWKYPGNEPVEAPGVPKRLGKLELLTQGEAEVHTDEDMNQGTRLSTFICFDTGYFHLPGLSWKVGRDSVISNPLVLEVAMLPVDTTLDFKDIDPPMQVPYTLRELIPYIGGALAVLLAIAGLVLLVRRKKRRVNPQASIDLRPAHIKALEQLELLEKEKPWQSGEEKEYHARLSAIFREYVAARFGRDTLDLTTGEFLSLCSGLGFSAQAITSLGHYLSLGDLVKFAKARATPLEHTESLEAVRQAVAQTALDPLPITQPNG